SDRSKHRMERLRQIELEQQKWEQDALVMPEAWDQLLLLSFQSVKTEFSDLDGLLRCYDRNNTNTARRNQVHEPPTPKATCSDLDESVVASENACWPPRPPPSSAPIYTSRSELASFAPGDTIRASRLAPPRSP
ncbi:hypothetical protein J3A83DRAFT_4045348, partial [Scleroderma citrinum]